MMNIIDRTNSDINRFAEMVSRLKPGESINIDFRDFRKLPTGDFMRNPFSPRGFTPADWVLENVLGSSEEFTYREDHIRRCIVFSRLEKPTDYANTGLMSYVSPDRRQYFNLRPDGLYSRNQLEYSPENY